MQELKVVEIFKSIEGEGLRAGELASFIRLYGCNLGCVYCDSDYATGGNNYESMGIEKILSTLNDFGCKNVTVTGGEPLLHQNINDLLIALTNNGYLVNIETNGSVDLSLFRRPSTLFFTCDYKCDYSGMSSKMILNNLKLLQADDVLKFVVANLSDLQQARKIIETYNPKCYIYFSPVFGVIEPSVIVDFMKKYNLQGKIRVQLQLHKIIYPNIERGV